MNYSDTIAAISTPYGKGGVAMIRVSGADALAVGDAVFSVKLSTVEANRAVHGDIYLPCPNGERRQIDDGIATVFRAPHSFTGEDTVEICCHGGVLLTEKVLSACFAAGARQAEAGEFTRRAFVNGKLSLDSAESLGALLDAGSDEQISLARSGMKGRLASATDALYDELLNVVAELRADIDFPDEDVSSMTADELYYKIVELRDRTVKLAATYSTGRAVREGIKTVICGAANAGKSSLYNRLVGEPAAIVTDVAGTTRDVLTDTVSFGGVTLRLSDTAGLRQSKDPVERIGIERAMAEIDAAELILAVFDATSLPTQSLIIDKVISANAYKIAVINKSDLVEKHDPLQDPAGFDAVVEISAKKGEGIDRLAKEVSKAFLDGEIDIDRDAVVSTARQYGALTMAAEALTSAILSLDLGTPTDFVCSDVEVALSKLGDVSGRQASLDIVDGIFSKFCVGK